MINILQHQAMIFIHIIKTEDKYINFQIWDMCGKESYLSALFNLYRNATIGILVYSIIDFESFKNLDIHPIFFLCLYLYLFSYYFPKILHIYIRFYNKNILHNFLFLLHLYTILINHYYQNMLCYNIFFY